MLKATMLAAVAALAISAPAVAQAAGEGGATVAASLDASVRDDVAKAIAALDAQDYSAAANNLRAVADLANRLNLQRIAAAVAAATPDFTAEQGRFALAASSTLTFESYLKDRNAVEQLLTDPDGNIVRVKVFAGDNDLDDFMIVAGDPAMLKGKGLELVEMRGEPAIKNRGADGSLSVLMMSEKDHALIEIDGASEDAVMAVIEQLEAAQ